MRRLYIGVGLLVILLAVGIFITAQFTALHEPLAEKLDAAARAALAENWEEATVLSAEANADWQKMRNFTAAVADHEPLEEMDALFARLEMLGKMEEADEFASDCAQLSRLAVALGQSQAITWWNLL